MTNKSEFVFTKREIQHIARIYRIPVTTSEINHIVSQLSKTVHLLEIFQRLRGKIKKPTLTYHAARLKNFLREDEIGVCLSKEEALANAPKKYEGYFQVPAIFKDK
jgi:aspartyl-tRNA(Asn)/glutamyl-tRNA(Gln) amidotransferase subunit C